MAASQPRGLGSIRLDGLYEGWPLIGSFDSPSTLTLLFFVSTLFCSEASSDLLASTIVCCVAGPPIFPFSDD